MWESTEAADEVAVYDKRIERPAGVFGKTRRRVDRNAGHQPNAEVLVGDLLAVLERNCQEHPLNQGETLMVALQQALRDRSRILVVSVCLRRVPEDVSGKLIKEENEADLLLPRHDIEVPVDCCGFR